MTWFLLVIIGIAAGIMAGLFGVGGGLIIVPALLWLLNVPMHVATATSMAALAVPVGLWLSVYNFHAAGKITTLHIGYGVVIALGLAFGAFFGSRFALAMDQVTLRKSFAVFLLVVAVATWFKN